jgi:outer membrane receptor protein involved in Fe transport
MPPLPRSIHVGALLALALAGPSNAQVVNPPNEPSGAVPEKKIPVEKKPAGSGEDTVELSPFTVTAENNGYQASNTMSGTRLNTKLEDLASSITVITKQQLIDTAAVDINDIFSNEGNTEGVFQYTDFTIDRGFTVDNVAQTPETANRVRGLGTANLARGNFAASRAIPVDTYNLDSVEISRGPNSNIFGLGEASGTVNLISGRANLTRDISQVLVRVDDRGSFRSTFDLNRVLWKNKLAVRLAAVHDDTEYVRKPSRDKSNRMTAAFSFRPFSNTTLRGSYESYHNFASRANSTTPRDTITEWRANGSPVWDPTFQNNTGGWRLLNGTTYTAMTAAQETAGLPRGMLNGGTGFWNRPSVFVNPDGTVGGYVVSRTSTTASPGGANTQLRYQQIGTAYQRGGGVYGVPLSPLFQQPGRDRPVDLRLGRSKFRRARTL